MRAGLLTSIFAHILILAWGFFGLPDTKPFDTSTVEALPVELVPISELTSLQKGKKTAEVKPTPSPAKSKEPDAPKPAPQPPKPAPPATPPPPKSEPPPPEPPAPEPEPAPAQPEPPKPAPEPPPAPVPDPPEQAEAEPPPPAPKPRAKPTPPKPVETAKAEPKTAQELKSTAESKFDPDKIAALLDRSKPTGSTQAGDQPEAFGAEEARNPTAMMTQSELDALRAQVQRCWNLPVGWTDPAEVTVTVRFSLNQDGTVSGVPNIEQYPASQYGTIAAEGAVRAILQCGPYNLPADKYDQWSEVQMRFSPQG